MTTRVSSAMADSDVGRVVQVVATQTGVLSTTTALIPLDNTIPQIGEGAEFMTRTITPTDAASLLRIDVVFCCASSNINNIIVALFRDATADAIGATVETVSGAQYRHTILFTEFVTAGSTSATTFRVRAGLSSAGTLEMNGNGAGAGLFGGVMASSITVTELRA